jgi:arsenate reductase
VIPPTDVVDLEIGVPSVPLRRRLLAELVGTGLLVAVVVGSGIMAERMSSDGGVQLLANAIATGAALAALILAFGDVSGARFNPLVSATAVVDGDLAPRHAAAELAAQTVGAIAGAIVANLMFDLPAVTWSTQDRSSGPLWLGEVVATFGLITVILGVVRSRRADLVPIAVGGYIVAAYWFTSSTSFANPAVTIARMFSDTFAGIRPSSVPAFLVAQILGAAAAVGLDRCLHPRRTVS